MLLLLNYTETEWLSQQFATRTESVTPFLVSFWQSTVKLAPSSDTWTDTARLDAKIIQQEGNFAGVMAQAMQEFGVDPQTGLAPIQWNSWETNWVVKSKSDRKEKEQKQSQQLKKKLLKQVGLMVDLVLTTHKTLLQQLQQLLLKIQFVIHFELIIKLELELEKLLQNNLIMNL